MSPAPSLPVDPARFAQDWIRDWNAHDLDVILAHYADDIEVTTPMIQVMLGEATGTLRGKPAVRAYWEAALQKVPDLHFELYDWTAGVDSVVLFYKSIGNRLAMEVMFFNETGKVSRMYAHYRQA